MLQKLTQIISVVTLLGAAGSVYANDDVAAKAFSCYQISSCTYFAELYQKDNMLQQQIAQAFEKENVPLPSWIAHSTSVPMIPVLIKGQSFLIGLAGEPHNMPHQAVFLYPTDGSSISIRYVDSDEKVHVLGNMDTTLVAVLNQYANPTTQLSQIVTSDYANLPVILNPYLP